MTAADLLQKLRARGVQLRVEAGQIRCRAPLGVLTPSLQAELREQRGKLIALLEQEAGLLVIHQNLDGSWPELERVPVGWRVRWVLQPREQEAGPLAEVNHWNLERRRAWAERTLELKATRGCSLEQAELEAARELGAGRGEA